jgi:uncharacterized repeat protein (TIGR01451 family)
MYAKPSGGWANTTQTQKLTASDGVANDFFGANVAVDAGKIVAGAPGDNNLEGAAYVFDGGEADLTVAKTNNAGGTLELSTPFTWTLAVSNTGVANANFSDGQIILTDTLPVSATYGAVTVQNVNDVFIAGNLSCSLNSNDLTCEASGGDVSIFKPLWRFSSNHCDHPPGHRYPPESP